MIYALEQEKFKRFCHKLVLELTSVHEDMIDLKNIFSIKLDQQGILQNCVRFVKDCA
jgi:hypothetical protein